MDTQILQLREPYEYIHCNGSTALHIATLIVYEAKHNKEGEYQLETHSHPIVKYYGRAGGVVWNKAELRNCDVVCNTDEMQLPLRKFSKLLRRHPSCYETEVEGTGFNLHPIWKRDLEDLGIKVSWPLGEDGEEHYMLFEVKLQFRQTERFPIVCEDDIEDFFFLIEAKDKESLKKQLLHQRNWYYQVFKEHQFDIRFTSEDPRFQSVIQEVNNTTERDL